MKFVHTICILLLAVTFSQAQISEGERAMSQGSHNSIQLVIPDVDFKETQKIWKKFISDAGKKGKTKYSKKTREYFTDDVEIRAIGGANTVDVYASFNEKKEDVEVTLWFDLGGAYLQSDMHGEKYTEGEKLLMRFAIEVTKSKTGDILGDEKNKQKNLEKDLDKLKKDNDGYHKDIQKAEKAIADAQQAIKQAKANIEQNNKDQTDTVKAIEAQKEVVKAVQERLDMLDE